MIDPHVHLRDWNQKEKETVEHGLMVAHKAGFTRLFDMPNTNPPITSREMAIERIALAQEVIKKHFKKSHMAYSLYLGITGDREQIREVVSASQELFPLVCGLKLFAGQSTGNMGIVEKSSQSNIFKALAEFGYEGVVAVHCEKEALMKSELFKKGEWETHSLARPRESEIESIKDIISAAKEAGFKGNLHIAHISTSTGIELVKKAREEGMKISCGVTPHHALLNVEDAKEHDRYLKMNPPLRGEEDRKAVFNALLDGSASWAESDHAPHTLQDKENGASGIPGFSGMLLLLDELRKAGASEEHLKDIFGRNALRTFGFDPQEIVLPQNPLSLKKKIDREYPIRPF
ncbi:MAG: dihydroorotase family protein [Sphaerochaetaceae bacterium]|nr:dihydroorotase family protein [Sphaerochaetaceae bacterium]